MSGVVFVDSGGAVIQSRRWGLAAAFEISYDAQGMPVLDVSTSPGADHDIDEHNDANMAGLAEGQFIARNGSSQWVNRDLAAGDIQSGTLAIARGGTNLGSYVQGDILYASAANVLSALAAPVLDGWVLTYDSGTDLPEWRAPDVGTVFAEDVGGTNDSERTFEVDGKYTFQNALDVGGLLQVDGNIEVEPTAGTARITITRPTTSVSAILSGNTSGGSDGFWFATVVSDTTNAYLGTGATINAANASIGLVLASDAVEFYGDVDIGAGTFTSQRITDTGSNAVEVAAALWVGSIIAGGTASGEITTATGPNTGKIYFSDATSRSIAYDGTNFVFTGGGIQLSATQDIIFTAVTDGIRSSVTGGALTITGGNSFTDGGNIFLTGSTHASPNEINLRAGAGSVLRYTPAAQWVSTSDFDIGGLTATTGTFTDVVTITRVGSGQLLFDGASGQWDQLKFTDASYDEIYWMRKGSNSYAFAVYNSQSAAFLATLTDTGALAILDGFTATTGTFSDNVQIAAGSGVIVSASNGALYLSGDTTINTGANIVLQGASGSPANDLQFRVGTINKLLYDDSSTAWSFFASARFGPGGAGAPGIAFTSDADTGLFYVGFPSTVTIGFAFAGVSELLLTASALYPTTAGGLTLGTVSEPWGGLFVGDASNYAQLSSTGDLIFVGTAGLVIGEIWTEDNSTETAIGSAGTWVQVTVFDTNGASNNTTPDHTNDHITITVAGFYKIQISATILSGAGLGADYECEARINNGATAFKNIHFHRQMAGGGGDIGAAPAHGYADLAVNDTVEVWVRNVTNTTNLVFANITLTVEQKIGT